VLGIAVGTPSTVDATSVKAPCAPSTLAACSLCRHDDEQSANGSTVTDDADERANLAAASHGPLAPHHGRCD
jgi:hypothetical protein